MGDSVPPRCLCCGMVLLLAALAPAWQVHGQPDPGDARTAGPLTVYPDVSRADRFYYPPGDLQVADGPDGAPDIKLVQVRYTGSFATGDRGAFGVRSLLSFRIEMAQPSGADMRGARDSLAARLGRRPDLRPLPITRLETVLLYTPVTQEQPGGAETLTGGRFEAEDDAGRSSATAYWRERTWVVRLDDLSAQLLGEALERGQVAASVGYAFFTRGRRSDEDREQLTGSPELVRWLSSLLNPTEETAETTPPPTECVVKAGAVAVVMDTRARPQIVRQVDINESAPPGYPVLDVRCHDFRDALRPDLVEKQVEIAAAGVGGRPVSILLTFERSQPDLYARTVRFALPVRLDLPYSYRVTEATPDGAERVGEWQQRESWAQLLDVTTVGARPLPPVHLEGQQEPEEDEDETKP